MAALHGVRRRPTPRRRRASFPAKAPHVQLHRDRQQDAPESPRRRPTGRVYDCVHFGHEPLIGQAAAFSRLTRGEPLTAYAQGTTPRQRGRNFYTVTQGSASIFYVSYSSAIPGAGAGPQATSTYCVNFTDMTCTQGGCNYWRQVRSVVVSSSPCASVAVRQHATACAAACVEILLAACVEIVLTSCVAVLQHATACAAVLVAVLQHATACAAACVVIVLAVVC